MKYPPSMEPVLTNVTLDHEACHIIWKATQAVDWHRCHGVQTNLWYLRWQNVFQRKQQVWVGVKTMLKWSPKTTTWLSNNCGYFTSSGVHFWKYRTACGNIGYRNWSCFHVKRQQHCTFMCTKWETNDTLSKGLTVTMFWSHLTLQWIHLQHEMRSQ